MKVYTALDIANMLKVNKITVIRWIKLGKLKAFMLGKQYRITQEQLDDFIKLEKKE